MGWADRYISDLSSGLTVSFRPRGNSMHGKITSGQLVTVEPLGLHMLDIGDIVLCTVKGAQYLHLVHGLRTAGGCILEVQIGNNKGRINGWTGITKVYGKLTKVEA